MRVVHLQHVGLHREPVDPPSQRLEQEGRRRGPVHQTVSMELHSIPRKYLAQPRQGAVVHEFREQDMRQQTNARQPLVDDLQRRSRGDDVPVAVGPRLADVLDHLEARGLVLQHLGALLADLGHRAIVLELLGCRYESNLFPR